MLSPVGSAADSLPLGASPSQHSARPHSAAVKNLFSVSKKNTTTTAQPSQGLSYDDLARQSRQSSFSDLDVLEDENKTNKDQKNKFDKNCLIGSRFRDEMAFLFKEVTSSVEHFEALSTMTDIKFALDEKDDSSQVIKAMELTEAQNMLAVMMLERQQKDATINNLMKKCQKLEEKLFFAQTQVMQRQTQIVDKAQEQIQTWICVIDSQEQTFLKQNSHLEQQYALLQAQNDSAQKQLSTAKAKVDSLTKELHEVHKTSTSLSFQVDSLQNCKQSAEKSIEELKEKLANTQNDLSSMSKLLEGEKRDNRSLQADYNELVEELRVTKEKCDEKNRMYETNINKRMADWRDEQIRSTTEWARNEEERHTQEERRLKMYLQEYKDRAEGTERELEMEKAERKRADKKVAQLRQYMQEYQAKAKISAMIGASKELQSFKYNHRPFLDDDDIDKDDSRPELMTPTSAHLMPVNTARTVLNNIGNRKKTTTTVRPRTGGNIKR